MSVHIEWHDNKPTVVLDDQSPPGQRKDVLRGDFAMVRYTDREGRDDTYLVVCLLEPANRKLVFRVIGNHDIDMRDFVVTGIGPGAVTSWLHLTQDSPGMAREAHEE